MSWPESKFVIDEIKDKITSMSIAPRKANSVSATYDKDTKIVTLTIGDSDPVYINTYPSEDSETPERSEVVRTTQYEIWKRLNEEITSYGEGVKIATINKESNITIYEDNVSDVEEDTDFHYAVFSTSDKEGINKEKFVTTSVTNYKIIYQVYGFKQDFTVLDPDQTISYPSIVIDPNNSNVEYHFINAEYTKMSITVSSINSTTGRLDFTTSPGDYLTFLKDFLKNKPYMVKSSDRTAEYQLSELDYDAKADGSGNSDWGKSTYSGGPFSWINKVYSREIYNNDDSYRIVMFSNNNSIKNYNFSPTGFINSLNQEIEGVWIPMGYTDINGKLNSGTIAVVSQTTENQKLTLEKLTNNAKFLGSPILNIIRDIEYMLFKSTDIQSKAGYGRCNGYNASYPTNYKNKYAINNERVGNNRIWTASGNNPSDICFKDPYGTGFVGCNNNAYKNVPASMFHSQVLGSYNIYIRDPYTLAVNGTIKVSPNYTYDITGDSYVDAGKTYSANKSGYPVKLFPTEAGSLPDLDDTSGSTTTGSTCDYADVNVSGVRVGRRLGNANNDLGDGPSCLNLGYAADYSSPIIGFATLLLPDPGYSPE